MTTQTEQTEPTAPTFDLKTWMAGIRRKEAAFKRMTKAQKRVAIAKDVLAAIRAKTLVPKNGTYLWVNDEKKDPGYQVSYGTCNDGDDAREVLAGAQCTACAIGGMFVSALYRHDKLTASKFSNNDDDMRSYLGEFFSDDQLSLIESAFEGVEFGLAPYKQINKAIAFNAGVPYPEEVNYDDPGHVAKYNADKLAYSTKRMVRIMKNIIANKGTFKP